MINPSRTIFARAMLASGIFVMSTSAVAQDTIAPQSLRYIFWQPDAVINFQDYVQPPDSGDFRMRDKYGIGVMGTVELLSAVDVPKKKRDLAKMGEAIYMAPAFCRECSAFLWEDSMGLKHDRIFFDMAEIATRNARKELDSISTSLHVDNGGVMFLETFLQDAEDMRLAMMRDYFVQVVIAKSDSAYVVWRTFVDEALFHTSAYTTRPDDCMRFSAGRPIKAGYVMPGSRMGDMFPEKRRR